MKCARVFVVGSFLFLLAAVSIHAEVTLPSVLGDHMVVQRGLPVHVWGRASEHESVTVTFRGETRTTNADDLGRWSVDLSPGEAGGPFPMVIKGANTIQFNDVLVGDAWVASGQSNMEFPMKELATPDAEIAAAQYPKIRIFRVEHRPSDYPRYDVEAKTWVPCTPSTPARLPRLRITLPATFIKKKTCPSDCSNPSGAALLPNPGRVSKRSPPMPH